MPEGLVFSERHGDGTEFRFYAISDYRNAFACFVKLSANRDDEWALAGLGEVTQLGPDFDSNADAFVAWFHQFWEAEGERFAAYFLRRGILYGRKLETIGQKPTIWAIHFDTVYSSLTSHAKHALAKLPTEVVRDMRDRARKTDG